MRTAVFLGIPCAVFRYKKKPLLVTHEEKKIKRYSLQGGKRKNKQTKTTSMTEVAAVVQPIYCQKGGVR